MENRKGYPRPVWDKNGHNTPLPWVGGNYPINDMWAQVDQNRTDAATDYKLCIVCGNALTPDFIYMLAFVSRDGGPRESLKADYAGEYGLPAPTYVHPKCGLIAAKFCPHIKNEFYPAMTQNGQKLTHAELSELARKSDKPVNDGMPDVEGEEVTQNDKDFYDLIRMFS